MSMTSVNQFPVQAVADDFCMILRILSFYWKEKALNEKTS